MTGLQRDDEDVVSSFVSVAFSGEAVAIEGKVAMTAAFVGLWAAVAGIVRVLCVVGLSRRAVRAGGFSLPRAGWRRVRRVGAAGCPLAGLRAGPGLSAEATPWFNVVKVAGTLRPGWTRARKVPRRFVR
jgi:hypothetical protein